MVVKRFALIFPIMMGADLSLGGSWWFWMAMTAGIFVWSITEMALDFKDDLNFL